MAESPHTTNPSRRLFLAAGSAGAVFGALSVAAAQEGLSPFREAMERHKRAYAKRVECEFDDDDMQDELADAEFYALKDLALAPCKSECELLEKIKYIYRHERIYYGNTPSMSLEFGAVILAMEVDMTGTA